jgi:HEAT repeat protein
LPLDAKRLEAVCEELTGVILNPPSSSEVRLQAAEALSWIDLPLAVPYLQKVLLESGDSRRLLAAAGLRRVASDEAVRVILDAYEKGDVFTQLDLWSTLAGMSDSVRDPTLRKRLEELMQRQQPFKFEN